MKVLYILVFLFSNIIHSQNKEDFKKIIVGQISDSTIIYRENGFDFYFNKSDILEKINDNIEYYSNINNDNFKDLKIKQSQDYYKLIQKDDCQLILKNPFDLTPKPSTTDIQNNIQYRFSLEFHFIACDLIDSGKFELKKDNITLKTLIKKKTDESEYDYFLSKESFNTNSSMILIKSCSTSFAECGFE